MPNRSGLDARTRAALDRHPRTSSIGRRHGSLRHPPREPREGLLGPTADILGRRLLLNGLELGALRREAVAPEKRLPYTLIIDEAHTFAGSDGALDVLLTAARKYRVSLVLAAQALALSRADSRRSPSVTAGTGIATDLTRYLMRSEQIASAVLLGVFNRRDGVAAQKVAPGLFEPQGNVPRVAVRAYDKIADPYLTAAEEMRERARELADLPIGACYWAMKGRPYRGRRIQVNAPDGPPAGTA